MNDRVSRQNIAEQLATALQTDVVWGYRHVQPDQFKRGEGANLSFISVDHDWGLWVQGQVTSRERNLVALLTTEQEEIHKIKRETPQQKLLSWLREVDQTGKIDSAAFELNSFAVEEWVPFCVMTDGASQPMREKEVHRVLATFFDGQVWVLPVTEGATFVLPHASLIYDGDETEQWQETLCHWAEGLVELFASELGEDVRAAVHPPVGHSSELGQAWLSLKQALSLGATLHPRQTVFTTWDMALERLVSSIPREECRTFLEGIASSSHSWWRDAELRETLAMFFQLNLNVSETARQMFLHRNTLIYRLDKLKQETGLDVRQFSDAMLIHLALLLTANQNEHIF